MKDTFGIRDSRNRYNPCPACGGELDIALCNGAVQCMACGFRGPSYPLDPTDILARDRAAFDAWNALPRRNP